MKIYQPLICILAVLLIHSCTTRYYIVRHAEKACNECATCALTAPQGSDRANALSDFLINKGIDTIFTSECLRTFKTAEPLANQLQKQISVYQRNEITSFINTLQSFHDNRNILVVGHSDQIPIMIEALTNRVVTIGELDFDNMYIITKKKCLSTKINFDSLTYGAPSP
jgi:broad specificity phosphatase PhoE